MGYTVGFSCALALWLSTSAWGFVGKNNTEAKLSFDYAVEFASDTKPTKAEAKEAIDDQLLYLYGPMQVAKAYGIPKGEHVTKVTKLEKLDGGLYRASYHYEGTIQVKKGPKSRYSVKLPRNTAEAEIYDKHCTDSHYPGYDDFWYFWNPDQARCSLEEGVHYDTIAGDLVRLPNTELTYPEYDRLVDTASDSIPIYVFFGKDEAEQNDDPFRSKDLNAEAYRNFRKNLVKNGFSEPEAMDADEMGEILEGNRFKKPFVEVTELKGKRANIRVTMFFGNTGIDEKSDAFHYFYKAANERAGLLIYDGHSGLGGTLDPAAIEERHGFKIKMNRSRYQIFFFNSCTSYSYYNSLYFYRKQKKSTRGLTKNLDILTQGLAAEFDNHARANLALVRAVSIWAAGKKAPSYQKLADQMDQNSLFGINGDEDNPTALPALQ